MDDSAFDDSEASESTEDSDETEENADEEPTAEEPAAEPAPDEEQPAPIEEPAAPVEEPAQEDNGVTIPIQNGGDVPNANPVSYTHLDVYKRQPVPCALPMQRLPPGAPNARLC